MNQVERVKEICKQKNIAISKLERECGFSNGYIRGLREGKFPADRLYTIAKYLEVSPEYILTGEEQTYYTDDQYEIAMKLFNAETRALLGVIKDCSPKQIKLVTELVEFLKSTNADG